MAIDSLDDVRLFRQVVASGGISAAARALSDNKNRISQRLAALERGLGVRLAHRTTRSLRLTEEGERFYAETAGLIEAAEKAEQSVAVAHALEGRVRLAVRSALVGLGMGAEIVRLLQSAPSLELQVAVVDESHDLLSGGYDLAVQVGALRDSSLVAVRLPTVSFSMAASSAYLDARGRPRGPGDLLRHSCIRRLSHPPETTWPLVHRGGRKVNARVSGTFECSDAQLQSEALYAGLGIGLRPAEEVRRAEAAGTLERVLPAWSFAPIHAWVVASKGRLRVPRVAAVVEILRRVVGRLALPRHFFETNGRPSHTDPWGRRRAPARRVCARCPRASSSATAACSSPRAIRPGRWPRICSPLAVPVRRG